MSNKIKRGGSAAEQSAEAYEISADEALNACRKYIHDFNDELRNLEHAEKRERIKLKIYEYVMQNKPLVAGFSTDDKQLDTGALIEYLIREITDRGILTAAFENPDINEIRVNEREIWVENRGRMLPYTDKNGKRIRFDSPEQQSVALRKLLGDTKLSGVHALVSSRTIEGYRVAAVHSSATSPDPLRPFDERYASVVIRKFETNKRDLAEIVRTGAASDSMAKLFKLFPQGGIAWATVGPTASGKTTTNNATLMHVPPNTRTILAQNPSEIDARQRDSEGNVINDVVHLEAQDLPDDSAPDSPTMANIMNHILRISPTYVCFGELRANMEFKLAMKIGLAGHPINCTYHAENSEGAISRFLTAYLAETPNEPPHLALKSLTSCLRFIIVQKIMNDGTRKILQVSEVLGVHPDNPDKPLLSDIFKFVPNKKTERDAAGQVLKIGGEHRRVGALSQEIISKFDIEGVQEEQYEFLTKPPAAAEAETYTGKIEYDFVNKRYIA
jgi:pilus assembly protein CpaF